MTERRRHRLSHARSAVLDRPVLTRRQKEKVDRLNGIASALDYDVRVTMPREHDAPAHLRMRGSRGETVHVVVFGGGEASRYAPPSGVFAAELPPALSRELDRR